MSVTLQQLGLPEDRGWVDAPRAGAYLPGTAVELRAGIEYGVAAPRRTLVFELRGTDGVVARDEVVVTVLSPSRPIELSVRVPDVDGVEYELALEVGGEAITWTVVVPEQRVDARFDSHPQLVRRGQMLHAVIQTGAIALNTGVAYWFERWDSATWQMVPFADGEGHAWAAMGLSIPAHTDWPLRVRVPERTEPGRHRLAKQVDAEQHGIGDVIITTEFTVGDELPVDYSSLLRTGTWNGVRPGASRASARSLLGEPDQRHDDDRVWGYGDLELHFLGDTLHSFAGRVIPDELLDALTAADRVGRWTEHLDSGAQLHVERPHTGTYVRLLQFSVAS